MYQPQCDFYQDYCSQEIPFQTQLFVPPVRLVAMQIIFDGKDFKQNTFPVVAIHHSIRECWSKDDEEGNFHPDQEKACRNSDELEEAGYQYHGRNIQTECLIVYDGNVMPMSEINTIRKFKWDDSKCPMHRIESIEFAAVTMLAYLGQMDELFEKAKEQVVMVYKGMQRQMAHNNAEFGDGE